MKKIKSSRGLLVRAYAENITDFALVQAPAGNPCVVELKRRRLFLDSLSDI
jgi:hypothetical protein